MGKQVIGRLSAREVETAKWQPPQKQKNPEAKPPRMLLDGKGLYLKITHSGTKSFVYRFTLDGRTRDLTLGTYPGTSLAEARTRCDTHRTTVGAGVDPIEKSKADDEAEQRQRAEAKEAAALAEANKMPFAEAVRLYRADPTYGKTRAGKVWNVTHRKQVDRILDLAAAPKGPGNPFGLGDKEASALTPDDIKEYLDPIYARTPETFMRTRGVLEGVLYGDKVRKLRGLVANPASRSSLGDETNGWLYKRGKPKSENQPAVDYREMPTWFAALRTRKGMAARALEFATLCASRSGECRGATWDEFIDLDGPEPVWRILGARMKAGKTHEVPLSPQAVALLKALPRMDRTNLVFPAARGGMLSDMALSMLMRKMMAREVKAGRRGWLDRDNGRPAVPHGIRSSFREFVTANHYDGELGERALAHDVGTAVTRAYSRDMATEPRRPIMAHWARYCHGEEAASANVVQLRGAV